MAIQTSSSMSRTSTGLHHEHLAADTGVVQSSDRAFGLVMTAFWIVVALAPLVRSGKVRVWSLALALVFLAASLLAPRTLHWLNLAWGGLAVVLHHIVSPVAMALLFFLAFTTTGALLRLFGKDLLRLRPEPENDSYWIRRQPPGPPPETMVHQF